MKVQLLDYTGKGSSNPSNYASSLLIFIKNTRLKMDAEGFEDVLNHWGEEKKHSELDYIAKTLRSSWEFVDYTFLISDVTRAFTHQLVRTRTGSYAQQAQRVVNMGEFTNEVPTTVAADPKAKEIWDSAMEAIASGYVSLQEVNIPNQDCRGLLPTNVHTNIVAKFNLRTLADLVAKRKNLRAQGEYADVACGFESEVLKVHPWAVPFLSPERTRTPALDALLKEALGDKGPLDKPEINAALKELDTLKGVWG